MVVAFAPAAVVAAVGVAAGVIAAAVDVAAVVVVEEKLALLCFVGDVVSYHYTISSKILVVMSSAVAAKALPFSYLPEMPILLAKLHSHHATSYSQFELHSSHQSYQYLTYLQIENLVGSPLSVQIPFQAKMRV